MVPTSVTSWLPTSWGRAQLPGQLIGRHIELAMEEEVMETWSDGQKVVEWAGLCREGATWKKIWKVNIGHVRTHVTILRSVPDLHWPVTS